MQKGQHKRRFKLKIKELRLEPNDRQMLMGYYQHLKIMNSLASKAAKDLRQVYINEIRDMRTDANTNYAHMFFAVTLALGPHVTKEIFSHYPEKSDIVRLKDDLLKRISKGRAENRKRQIVRREFQGMRYDMLAPSLLRSGQEIVGLTGKIEKVAAPKILPGLIGGGAVFPKQNSIIDLMKGEEYRGRIRRAKRPYDKSNFVGVELELIAKISREKLDDLFIKAQLAGSVYVKGDGSIRRENDNEATHEITLIAKENKINEVISRVCQVLNSKEVGAYVNNSCGLHVHLDMRNRDPEVCYHNLFNSLSVLASMVPPDRVDTPHGQRFCSLVCANTFKGAIEEGVRYKALNAISYESHQTLEIRLHSGSLNAMKINNWVNILMAVVNSTIKRSQCNRPEEMQAEYGLSDQLVDYMKMRALKFKDRSLDTRKDHFNEAVA